MHLHLVVLFSIKMVATFSDHCASFVCDTNVPAERVPEVSNVDVSTDPTTFSVDFPPDAGVEPIEVTVKREVVMRCSAGIFGPFLVGRSEQEARKFLAGAYAVVSLFLRTGPGPTEEESAALQAFFLHLPCSRPVLKTAVGPTLELISNTEIVLLGLLCLWLHRKNADSSSWIVVDLPPGVGKTFAVERLAAIVNKNREPTIATVITTPTMKTAQLYPRALKANTLHANFMIKVQFLLQINKLMCTAWVPYFVSYFKDWS